jgi:16S rRNA (uracil1498-N3)-methyltransferase
VRISRIFTTAELRAETVIELNDGIAKYVRDVLRLTVGHSIIVFNGDGNDYPGELIDVQKKTVRVQLQQAQTSDTESALQLHLLQPLCAGDKFDLCLQKATELGVTQITPFISSRVNVNLPANRLEKKMAHWQGVIQSACEQSGRAKLPQLNQPIPFQQALLNCPTDSLKLIASPTANRAHSPTQPVPSISCLIGPEGGFSPDEVTLAEQHGFQSIKMGPRILRLETAVISLLSLLQAQHGDLNRCI